ncbi:hypothetical protein [Rhizobium cauense]|nr:hypothetical protein [Rhizobium cauense]
MATVADRLVLYANQNVGGPHLKKVLLAAEALSFREPQSWR